jgi:NADH:ubiquinone oxidoreductase subunit F (NADH-binding)
VTGHAGRARQSGLPRLLPEVGEPPEGWNAHLAHRGPVPYRNAAGALIADIEASGLTGRGGAAFPVHRKLAAVREASARKRVRPVVIANGAEGEPASDKDATLLWLVPHLVLDGLQLVAETLDATEAILYVHAEHGDLIQRLERAIHERTASDDRVRIRLAAAPPRFLAGQETALVSHLGGGPAIPTFQPPRVSERGLDGIPTLVQNVETLAHLALIARHGPYWFRAVGTRHEPGSMLCTIRATDGRPRVHEVPLGIPLSEVFGVDLNRARAVLIGGYHGTWVSAAQAARLRLDNQSLKTVGAIVGAGILLALPADRCGLIETARGVRYLALESAGQCGPCLNGLPRISAALTELARGRASGRTVERTRSDLERWAGLMPGRGACHHPDGTVRFVRSALTVFAAEITRHERGQCGAETTVPFLPVPKTTARTEEDWL